MVDEYDYLFIHIHIHIILHVLEAGETALN